MGLKHPTHEHPTVPGILLPHPIRLPYSIFMEALGLVSVQVNRFSKEEPSRVLVSS